MEFRLFRYFVAVAEELSFTRAAERLHTAQPSLSQQIRDLEQIVGTALFRRDKHHVQLTEAGRVLLDEARVILKSTERAIVLAGCTAKRINLGVVPGPVGEIFRRIGPILLNQWGDIQIHIRTLPSPEQIVALQNHQLNVGFLHGPIKDDAIASEVVLRAKIMAVLPRNHPLAQRPRIPVRLLAKVPLIQWTRTIAPAIHDIVNEASAQAGVQFRTLLQTGDMLMALNAVASGVGFCMVGSYLRHVLPKSLVAKPLDLDSLPELEVLAAYRKDDTSPAVQTLLTLIRQSTRFKKRPQMNQPASIRIDIQPSA